MVIENNHYIVEDDYRDEVEHIFKTNPEILDHCSEEQNNAESVPASTHVFFDATRLSEELERVDDLQANCDAAAALGFHTYCPLANTDWCADFTVER